MPAKTYLNDAGTWRDIRNIHINSGGTWRNIRQAWVNDSGTWRLVFQSVFVFVKVFSSDTADYNLYNDLIANGWNGNQTVDATLTVNSGVRVYASSVGTYAMNISNLPSTSVIRLTNNGTITGRGGNGGAGGNVSGYSSIGQIGPGLTGPGFAGTAGGPAMFIRNAITIINNGVIGSGGGGGGGGGSAMARVVLIGAANYTLGGGGGGGGAGSSNAPSSGGSAGQAFGIFSTDIDGQAGSAGGNAAGAGGPAAFTAGSVSFGSAGGAGGARGSSGGAGIPYLSNAIGSTSVLTWNVAQGAGASAGIAIDGNSFTTFSTLGTVSGPRIN